MRTGYNSFRLAIAILAIGCDDGNGGGNGTVQFTASGEVLALGGYAFPPATADDPSFVDGWEVHFDKFLAVFDKVTLSDAPDTSPTDESKTGTLVAEVDGPFAIDLHKGGPLMGKGGSDEQAVQFATVMNQNKNGNRGFDPTVRYAFGFDSVAATASATRINVDASDPDYAEMVQKGWNVLYVGTATWKGNAAGVTCTSTDPSYNFGALPTTVKFRLGFKTPTSYVNCQNPDNDPAAALGSEEHQRGVQIKENTQVTAQVTFHTDHPFWESFVHDAPAHFDQLAAIAKKQADNSFLVTLDDTTSQNPTAFTDAAGKPLPWRACANGYMPPNTNQQMGFDAGTVPVNPSGDPATSIRNYTDYMNYNQSTQGHLNSDGLCYVQRHYPSPQ
jgi:hypothetical protein